MKTRNVLAIAIAAAVLVVAWYLFRPERLWIDSTVSEALDDVAVPGALGTASAAGVVLLRGVVRGVQHEGTGSATVFRLGDGRRVLRLTEFATSNGPDLFVYLVAANDAPDDDTVKRAGFASLGRLKGNKGDQNYLIPPELDLSRYRAVSIWCKRFGVNFAAAALVPQDESAEIVTVRPRAEVMTKQGLPNFVGISEATAGATHLSMNVVVIPPGGAATPHIHSGFESAIYVVEGRVETRYGHGLTKSVLNQAGDFLFIPAGVPHQPRNLSSTERALAIVARNSPNEQESVVPYHPEEH